MHPDIQHLGDPESGATAAQDIWSSLWTGGCPADMCEKVGCGHFGAFFQGLEHCLSSGHPMARKGSAGIPTRSAISCLICSKPPIQKVAYASRMIGKFRLAANEGVATLRIGAPSSGYTTHVDAEFARLGIGRFRVEPCTERNRSTTCVVDDPREGVVDRNCAVDGMDNLYVL